MVLILRDIDYGAVSFPGDLLMANAPPVLQQPYSGLCTFEPPQVAPVSTTVDVEFEQSRLRMWLNIPLRVRLNAEAFLDQRGQGRLRTTSRAAASEASGDEASQASASA
eukprot:1431350-Lingulodinium_polyedra.AAC.1